MHMKDASNNPQQAPRSDKKEPHEATEIETIEREQRAVVERMMQVQIQQARVKHLLDVLQSLDDDEGHD
ncbi:unnamed protein product [Adineta ricciae]|uniref:Uncharacterized protein n=1 Tax=Adineta ricciae TaxID=249248 RepID=A0A813VLR6_ADIRI|nr:unnamed protein product [Adineta ricciae]CAF0839384.1 unnamed protein product [Adineta ricciae]